MIQWRSDPAYSFTFRCCTPTAPPQKRFGPETCGGAKERSSQSHGAQYPRWEILSNRSRYYGQNNVYPSLKRYLTKDLPVSFTCDSPSMQKSFDQTARRVHGSQCSPVCNCPSPEQKPLQGRLKLTTMRGCTSGDNSAMNCLAVSLQQSISTVRALGLRSTDRTGA